MKEIVNLKTKLVEEFSMKDLTSAKKFFEMRTSIKRKEAFEVEYVEKVAEEV